MNYSWRRPYIWILFSFHRYAANLAWTKNATSHSASRTRWPQLLLIASLHLKDRVFKGQDRYAKPYNTWHLSFILWHSWHLHYLLLRNWIYNNFISQIRYRDVKPGEFVTYSDKFLPRRNGERKIVASFSSRQLDEINGSTTVNVRG